MALLWPLLLTLGKFRIFSALYSEFRAGNLFSALLMVRNAILSALTNPIHRVDWLAYFWNTTFAMAQTTQSAQIDRLWHSGMNSVSLRSVVQLCLFTLLICFFMWLTLKMRSGTGLALLSTSKMRHGSIKLTCMPPEAKRSQLSLDWNLKMCHTYFAQVADTPGWHSDWHLNMDHRCVSHVSHHRFASEDLAHSSSLSTTSWTPTVRNFPR